jgi:hypothetical protein
MTDAPPLEENVDQPGPEHPWSTPTTLGAASPPLSGTADGTLIASETPNIGPAIASAATDRPHHRTDLTPLHIEPGLDVNMLTECRLRSENVGHSSSTSTDSPVSSAFHEVHPSPPAATDSPATIPDDPLDAEETSRHEQGLF